MTTTPADPDATQVMIEPKLEDPADRETDDALLRHEFLVRTTVTASADATAYFGFDPGRPGGDQSVVTGRKSDGKFTFVAEVPAGSKLIEYAGRLIMLHPDLPPQEITASGPVPIQLDWQI